LWQVSNSQFLNNNVSLTSSTEGDALGGGISCFFNSQFAGLNVTIFGVIANLNVASNGGGNEGKSYGGGVCIFLNESQTSKF
jgi:hypothetical protein